MNPKNIKTSSNFGNELRSVLTSSLIDGMALMLFNGLRTLKFLNDFKLTVLTLLARLKMSKMLNN